MSKALYRVPPIRIGLLTLDSVNEYEAGKIAARSGDLVIAAPRLDSLQRAGVDVVAYDLDHLKFVSEKPTDLVVPGAARVQLAFGYNLSAADVKQLRSQGVIVCRRLKYAVRIAANALRKVPAAAA